MTVRVFLLDDHEIVRRGLRELLEAEDDLEVVGEARHRRARRYGRIPATAPNVAILDVRLPDGDGVEVCRDDPLASIPRSQCLMLTSFADDEALFRRSWPAPPATSSSRSRAPTSSTPCAASAAGESLLDPPSPRRVLERLRTHRRADERLAALTDQERRILDLIAEGLTNRQIGEQLFLAEKTVKNYVSNLLAKLGHEPPHRSRRVLCPTVRAARPRPSSRLRIDVTPRSPSTGLHRTADHVTRRSDRLRLPG